MKFLKHLRVLLKLLLRHFFLLPAFCKMCGRTVHDFIAPGEIWIKVTPLIKHGNIVCYDCFCELCQKVGEKSVWELR